MKRDRTTVRKTAAGVMIARCSRGYSPMSLFVPRVNFINEALIGYNSYILGDKLHLQSFSAPPMMLLLKVEVTVGDEGQLAPSQLPSKLGFA